MARLLNDRMAELTRKCILNLVNSVILSSEYIAGSIHAAETIIHGRRRGSRTATQYRWSIRRAMPFTSREAPLAYFSLKPRGSRHRISHKEAHKAQANLEENKCL
jgi:hypothetical protein